MTYDQYKQIAQKEASKGRKNFITAYLFLLLSAVFFAVFFGAVQELPVIGCAFLCDAAAFVYLRRALKRICPFWQAILARQCAATPSKEALYRLCAALEYPKDNARYGNGPKEAFTAAYQACSKCPEVEETELRLLENTLNSRAAGWDGSGT